MSGLVMTACAVAACICGGASFGCAVALGHDRRRRARRRGAALGSRVGGRSASDRRNAWGWALRYAERLDRRLFMGATEPLTPSVRARRAGETRSGARYKEQALTAGCAKDVTVSAFCEARTRLAAIGAVVGALFGLLFSAELSLLLGVGGACLGGSLPGADVRKAARQRALDAELHLSEMLEVVALGLRSGLTFDRSFALYGSHFDGEFARSCMKAHRSWSLGLCDREEALRDFAASYECDQLSRVVDSMIRSLKFGSSLAGVLEEAGAQSRATYRASLEERVAKAPVKMMLPTGTLILPAMLLLVMGPVLLELAGGF